MIKISTKGRYGSRLMLNLARHHNNGNRPVILHDVAKEEDISIRYLEQIIIQLKIKKLVKNVRGAGGGYILAKAPSKIKLNEIVEALEGPICLVDCVDDGDYCNRVQTCPTHQIWKQASNILRDYFEKMTVQDLIEISKVKNPIT
jgi:Rrf2 family protein